MLHRCFPHSTILSGAREMDRRGNVSTAGTICSTTFCNIFATLFVQVTLEDLEVRVENLSQCGDLINRLALVVPHLEYRDTTSEVRLCKNTLVF